MPQEIFEKFRIPVLVLLGGVLLTSLGLLFVKGNDYFSPTKVEVINASKSEDDKKELVVEITGEVIKPGVYKLPEGVRVDDILTVSGGFSANADRVWTDKYLNRASLLTDGQKIYIPKVGEQNSAKSANNSSLDQNASSQVLGQNNALVNINTASAVELDRLPGIGPTYAQKIIEQRPYSNTEELLNKKVLTKSTYEKIKNQISIY